METGRNIHCKRSRELHWGNEASQELLRLRYKTLRPLFDEAETVADVHEAWGIVASRLNAMESLDMEELDPVNCSDQLTKLRLQWHDSNTQLHLMMAECFGKQQDRRTSFNRVMEETMEASPKRRPTESPVESQVEGSLSPGPASPAQLEAPLSPEPDLGSPSAVQPEEQVEISNLQAVQQESAQREAPAAEEEVPRQDKIMRALEKRSDQLERLAQSHQHLADVTQKLMEALVNQHNL